MEDPPGEAFCPEWKEIPAPKKGKAMSPRSVSARRAAEKYLALVRDFPLRPLRTEKEKEQAIEVVSALGSRSLAPCERDYLAVLVGLVEKFEEEHYPMAPVRGPAMIRHLIEARGVTQAVVAAEAGIAESALSEVLTEKRGMSLKYAMALARYFGVTVDLIAGE
jgi:HTH-type transcriptional regulator / antitoxin HigA